MTTLMTERHAQAAPRDERAARIDERGHHGVLGLPAAFHPRADAFVVVHDGDRGVLRSQREREIERGKLGEDIAQPSQRVADRFRRRQQQIPRYTSLRA